MLFLMEKRAFKFLFHSTEGITNRFKNKEVENIDYQS